MGGVCLQRSGGEPRWIWGEGSSRDLGAGARFLQSPPLPTAIVLVLFPSRSPSPVPLFSLAAAPAQGGGAVKVRLAGGSEVQPLGVSAALGDGEGGALTPPRCSVGPRRGRETSAKRLALERIPALGGLAQTVRGVGPGGRKRPSLTFTPLPLQV